MALTSQRAIGQAIAQFSDQAFLVLLTVTHPDLPDPIRVVRNRKQIVSRGNTFLAFPFEVELPTDGSDAPQAQITVSNVSRRIGKALEALVTPPNCLIELVLASTPDTVERAWDQFLLTEASWDAFNLTGTISRRTYWDEPWPRKRVTPAGFPGLFP
jgi:hypothetical protein